MVCPPMRVSDTSGGHPLAVRDPDGKSPERAPVQDGVEPATHRGRERAKEPMRHGRLLALLAMSAGGALARGRRRLPRSPSRWRPLRAVRSSRSPFRFRCPCGDGLDRRRRAVDVGVKAPDSTAVGVQVGGTSGLDVQASLRRFRPSCHRSRQRSPRSRLSCRRPRRTLPGRDEPTVAPPVAPPVAPVVAPAVPAPSPAPVRRHRRRRHSDRPGVRAPAAPPIAASPAVAPSTVTRVSKRRPAAPSRRRRARRECLDHRVAAIRFPLGAPGVDARVMLWAALAASCDRAAAASSARRSPRAARTARLRDDQTWFPSPERVSRRYPARSYVANVALRATSPGVLGAGPGSSVVTSTPVTAPILPCTTK